MISLQAFSEGLIIIGLVIYLVGLARVTWYEKKINELHEAAKRETKAIQGRGVVQSIVQAQAKSIHEKYQAQIDELERKRRFILEKLPFFRK